MIRRHRIIEQALTIKTPSETGKMDLSKELDYSLTPVHVNAGQMKQIFIALISNAFDAMEGQGRLTIRTAWHDTEIERAVCVQFSDTGCGIPAEHLPKIFDPFFTTKPLGEAPDWVSVVRDRLGDGGDDRVELNRGKALLSGSAPVR